MHGHRSQRLAAKSVTASFVTEHVAPATDATGRAGGIPTENNRARSGDHQNTSAFSERTGMCHFDVTGYSHGRTANPLELPGNGFPQPVGRCTVAHSSETRAQCDRLAVPRK